MQVYVDQVGLALGAMNDVALPHLLRERLAHALLLSHDVSLLRDERDRRIVALAVPALGTLAIEPIYLLVDTAIVGRLGTAQLGGLALASTVLASLVYLWNFLTTGTTARVAFLTGQARDSDAAAVIPQALWLAAAIGATLAVTLPFLARSIAHTLGGRGDTLDAATTYLRISAISLPAVLVALVGNGWHRGRSDTRTPLVVVLVANVLNVILEVVLVYGFDLGVAGSAWGTVVAQLVAGSWFLVLLARAISPHSPTLTPVAAELRRLLRVARQIALRTAALLSSLAIATAVAARIGPASLGGHQIAYQVWFLLALTMDALAVAAQAMVGTALGRGDAAEARATAIRILRFALVAGVGFAVVTALVSQWLPRAFTSDAAVVDRAGIALLLVALSQLPAAVAFTMDGVLEGASDFGFLQWALLGSLVAFVPLALAVHALHLGIGGLWAAIVVWLAARSAILLWRFRGERWTALAATPAGTH